MHTIKRKALSEWEIRKKKRTNERERARIFYNQNFEQCNRLVSFCFNCAVGLLKCVLYYSGESWDICIWEKDGYIHGENFIVLDAYLRHIYATLCRREFSDASLSLSHGKLEENCAISLLFHMLILRNSNRLSENILPFSTIVGYRVRRI